MKNKEKQILDVFAKAYRQRESSPVPDSAKDKLLQQLSSVERPATKKPLDLGDATRASVMSSIHGGNVNAVKGQDSFDSLLNALRESHQNRHNLISLSAQCREKLLRELRSAGAQEHREDVFWSLVWPTVRLMTPVACLLFVYALSLPLDTAPDYAIEQFIFGEVAF